MKTISIQSNSIKTHVLSIDEYVRWGALIEALDHITITAKKKKIDLTRNSKWIKPLEINRYIQNRFPALRHDIGVEENLTG